MNNFLEPTKGKIILTIVLTVMLFLCSFILSSQLFLVFDGPQSYGLPLFFQESGCYGLTPIGHTAQCVNNVNYLTLIIDLIFWVAVSYAISSLLIRKEQ